MQRDGSNLSQTKWQNGYYFALDDVFHHPETDGDLLPGQSIVKAVSDAVLSLSLDLIRVVVSYCLPSVLVSAHHRYDNGVVIPRSMDMTTVWTTTRFYSLLVHQYGGDTNVGPQVYDTVLALAFGRFLFPPRTFEDWPTELALVGPAGSGKSTWEKTLRCLVQEAQLAQVYLFADVDQLAAEFRYSYQATRVFIQRNRRPVGARFYDLSPRGMILYFPKALVRMDPSFQEQCATEMPVLYRAAAQAYLRLAHPGLDLGAILRSAFGSNAMDED